MYATHSLLLIFSQATGVLLLVSTVLLLWFGKIYLDAKTGKPIEFSLPIFGKIKSQTPAFLMILLGAFLVIFPLLQKNTEMVTLEGNVQTGGKPVTVVVVAIPQYGYEVPFEKGGPIRAKVPLIEDAFYRIKFIVNNQVIWDEDVSLDGGRLHFKEVNWEPPPEPVLVAPVRKEVSDAKLKALGIIH